MPARGVRHREPREHGLAAGDVDQDTAARLPRPPAAGLVRLAEGGDEPNLVVDHAEPVQVAAVLGLELGDEGGRPAGDEAVAGVERREAGEAGGDDPELILGELDLVDLDVAGEVPVSREVGGVVLAGRVDLRRDRGEVSVVENFRACPEGEAVGQGRDPHRPVEVAKVGVDQAAVVTGADQLPGLVGRDQQGAAKLIEDLGHRAGVDAAKGRVGRWEGGGAGSRGVASQSRARSASGSALATSRLETAAAGAARRSPSRSFGRRAGGASAPKPSRRREIPRTRTGARALPGDPRAGRCARRRSSAAAAGPRDRRAEPRSSGSIARRRSPPCPCPRAHANPGRAGRTTVGPATRGVRDM